MSETNLNNMVAGFEHEAYGSQAVFRAALKALSYPGQAVPMPLEMALPSQGLAAAAALLLGLVDSDTSLWLSPRLVGSDTAAWLRFHTGCNWISDPGRAQFLWVALGDSMPSFTLMNMGTDEYPDQSGTCVLEVPHVQYEVDGEKNAWVLRGPGILNQRSLSVQGLPADFAAQWSLNQASFPRGVDVFLATDTHIVGLPRTTQLSKAGGV